MLSLLVSWTPDLRLALSLTHVLLLEQRRSQRPTVPAQRYPVPNLSFANKRRPSDILIERFVAWKAIVKQLVLYFQGLADIGFILDQMTEGAQKAGKR